MKNSWKCNQCGYILRENTPPSKCPSCQKECTFIDVTCYTPDCGGPGSGNIDPQLINKEPKR
jgi:rubredoxin